MPINLQQLQKDGIYEAKSPIEGLLADLDQIASAARDLAARRKRTAKRGVLVLLAAIIVAILAGVAGFGLIGLIAFLAAIGGVVLLLKAAFTGVRITAHPNRVAIVKERLAMIQADAGHKPFSLRLLLISQPACVRKEDWPKRKNGRQEFYEEQWLSLEGPLADGTVLSDEIRDLSRKRFYRNPRGKYKSKTRTRYLVDVRFTYPAERYGDARTAQQALSEEVKMAPGALLKRARVTEKAVAMRAIVNSEVEIPRAAGILSMGAYRILNLARRVMEKKGGNAK